MIFIEVVKKFTILNDLQFNKINIYITFNTMHVIYFEK